MDDSISISDHLVAAREMSFDLGNKCAEHLECIGKAYGALKFYADLKYSDKWGLPPEVQWVAENAMKEIENALRK